MAPALIHKAEAIVSPKDLIPYLGQGRHTGKEGNLAYHNSLMVQFWSSVAARQTRLMTHVLREHFPQSFVNATWGTYLRCHDDIGWAVTDEDAAAVGISGAGHRAFLADFFTGRYPTSFARGGDFQSNPETGDRRTNGSCASLLGLETALETNDQNAIDAAIHRILMGHALIASFGGIPLIYMGDELGLLNDHAYEADEHLKHDGRWMHRPRMDWARAARRYAAGSVEAQIFSGLRHIIARRRATAHLHGTNPTAILDLGIDGSSPSRGRARWGRLSASSTSRNDGSPSRRACSKRMASPSGGTILRTRPSNCETAPCPSRRKAASGSAN